MVKKLRLQENRTSPRRRSAPRGAWVLEPRDGALIGAAIALALWLQWVSQAS